MVSGTCGCKEYMEEDREYQRIKPMIPVMVQPELHPPMHEPIHFAPIQRPPSAVLHNPEPSTAPPVPMNNPILIPPGGPAMLPFQQQFAPAGPLPGIPTIAVPPSVGPVGMAPIQMIGPHAAVPSPAVMPTPMVPTIARPPQVALGYPSALANLNFAGAGPSPFGPNFQRPPAPQPTHMSPLVQAYNPGATLQGMAAGNI